MNRHFPVIRFQAAIISKRTARFKRNDLSRRASCLPGCSIVKILALARARRMVHTSGKTTRVDSSTWSLIKWRATRALWKNDSDA